jgi:hypothetical protein
VCANATWTWYLVILAVECPIRGIQGPHGRNLTAFGEFPMFSKKVRTVGHGRPRQNQVERRFTSVIEKGPGRNRLVDCGILELIRIFLWEHIEFQCVNTVVHSQHPNPNSTMTELSEACFCTSRVVYLEPNAAIDRERSRVAPQLRRATHLPDRVSHADACQERIAVKPLTCCMHIACGVARHRNLHLAKCA